MPKKAHPRRTTKTARDYRRDDKQALLRPESGAYEHLNGGQCFRAGQVFFPRTGAWDKIRRAIKADFDDTVWEHLRGSVSAPFVAGEQVAVKVIDDRGNELMVTKKTRGTTQ